MMTENLRCIETPDFAYLGEKAARNAFQASPDGTGARKLFAYAAFQHERAKIEPLRSDVHSLGHLGASSLPGSDR